MANDFIANQPQHAAPDEESNVDAMVIIEEDTVQGADPETINSGFGNLIVASGDMAWNRPGSEDCVVHLLRGDKNNDQVSGKLSMLQVTQFLAACSFKIISSQSIEDNTRNSLQINLPGGAAITISLPTTKVPSEDSIVEFKERHPQLASVGRSTEDVKDAMLSGALSEPLWTANNQKITRVYYRNLKGKKPDPPAQPIFQNFEHDHADHATIGKRKSAPVSCSSLRRSKRNATVNDGFKPTSPLKTKKEQIQEAFHGGKE
jgi:hypothetical protein